MGTVIKKKKPADESYKKYVLPVKKQLFNMIYVTTGIRIQIPRKAIEQQELYDWKGSGNSGNP